MRVLILSVVGLACFGGLSRACDYCVGAIVAPVRVEYRLTQPLVVRETIQVERTEYLRQPVIVERQEKVLQYQADPVVVQPQVHAYGAAVQRVQVQQVQKVRVQPVVVQQVQVQKFRAPAVVVEQNVVQRRGLFGRNIVRSRTVVK